MALRVVVILLTLVVAIPTGEAQLGVGSLPIVGGILKCILPGGNAISVQGKVFCTVNGNIGTNGLQTPVFANAAVELQCGSNGKVVGTSTTNEDGEFAFLLSSGENLVSSLPRQCNVALKTPLSNCNVDLPAAGGLQSQLMLAGNHIVGQLNITNFAARGFTLN